MTQKFKVVHYCLNPNPKTDTLQKPFFTITCKNKNIGFIYNVDFINEQSHSLFSRMCETKCLVNTSVGGKKIYIYIYIQNHTVVNLEQSIYDLNYKNKKNL